MKTRISNQIDYTALLAEIETYLQRVTEQGSFDTLSAMESDQLHRLSLLVEAYEKSIPLVQ